MEFKRHIHPTERYSDWMELVGVGYTISSNVGFSAFSKDTSTSLSSNAVKFLLTIALVKSSVVSSAVNMGTPCP